MSRWFKGVLAGGLLALGTAVTAPAATIEAVNLGPVTGMDGWSAFKVSVTATMPGFGNATVVDLSSNGQGIYGPMHQRWTFVVDEETEERVYTKSPQDAGVSPTTGLARFDSHLLLTNDMLIGSTYMPEEDNNFVNQVGGPNDSASSDYGLGTFIKATVGLLPAYQAPTLDIAYLVIKDGESVTITGNLANAVGTKDAFSGVVAVPEPGAIMGIGAMTLLVLGRRRMAM